MPIFKVYQSRREPKSINFSKPGRLALIDGKIRDKDTLVREIEARDFREISGQLESEMAISDNQFDASWITDDGGKMLWILTSLDMNGFEHGKSYIDEKKKYLAG